MFFSRSFKISGVIGQEVATCLSDDWGVVITTIPEKCMTVIDCSKKYPKNKIALHCGLSADYANTVSKLIQAISSNSRICTVKWPLQDETEIYNLIIKLAFDLKLDFSIEQSKFNYIATIDLTNTTSNLYGSINGKRVLVKNGSVRTVG